MQLVITVRKEVPDAEAGETIYDLVKDILKDKPNLVITGHITNHFDLEPEPE